MKPATKIRFEALSDGVFAIAVTLLALQLRVPDLQSPTFSFVGLIPIIPSLLTFVLSFVTIAIFWVNHHQLTQRLATITRRRILWLNMLFLLFLILVPFVTQTMSVNIPSAPAVSLYAMALFGASASFSFLRYWIHHQVHSKASVTIRTLIGPSIYFLAILAPMISVPLAYVLLSIPPLFYFLPKSSM